MYLNIAGLLVGTVFFAFSLTPSLLPRPFLIQGVLSGLSFAAGYGVGVGSVWLWHYLQLPVFRSRWARLMKEVAAVLCALIAGSFVWQANTWQNSIRAMMGMEESTGGQPVLLVLMAALVFLVVLGLARLFRRIMHALSVRLRRCVPDRISHLTGTVVAVVLFWSVIDGVLMTTLLRVADRSFQQLDALIDDELPRPTRPLQTGSAASLVNWEDLGRQGRLFVAGGPTAEDLSTYFDTELPAPIRVYVGLNSAETSAQRARLALEELKRAGGFGRSILLLVTPTGTGWVDSSSQNTFDYLHRGDVATVAAQYSYLNSPLTLMTAPDYGVEAARAMFTEIYGYWRTLPKDSRPKLYLRGLSLGALNSDLSFDLYDIIDDPFHGALWSGPAIPQQHLATHHRATRPGHPGMAARVSWRLGDPLHESGARAGPRLGRMGCVPDRIPAIRQRPDHLLQPRHRLVRTGLDARTARAGRVTRSALVSDRDDAATSRRYGGRYRPERFRSRICARALHRRVAGTDRTGRMDGVRRGAPEGLLQKSDGLNGNRR